MVILLIIFILFGYLIGSIPTGWLISKYIYKMDITRVGSGNIGATNLTRVHGKKAGAYTLIGDGIKALLYMLILRLLVFPHWQTDTRQALYLLLCGLAVLIGNCFSVFLKFHGGKGGTTTYGVFLALTPLPALTSIAIYALALLFTRVSAIGTLSSTLLLGVWIYFFYLDGGIRDYLILFAFLFTLIVWFRHISNIRKMIKEGF